MKMKIFLVNLFTFLLMAQLGMGQEKQFQYTGNPLVQYMFTADPSARVWEDGRLYVYPSQDIGPPSRGCDFMNKYHVFSTDDMVNWIDHGQILEAADVPWKKPLTAPGAENGTFMWAPDCVYKDGKYYFYFPTPNQDPWGENWKIGIAVSDKPASDFVVLDTWLQGLPNSGHIDPNIFIDDDGQAYFYYGGGGSCLGGKLKDNMTEIDGELIPMTGLTNFHEGAWMFKRNGVYYMTYPGAPSGASPNGLAGDQLRHATSNSPLGPWTYRGVYMQPTGCGTNHGSVLEYKGEWYAFYHNKAIDPEGYGNLRSICFDKVYFDANGRMLEVKQTKSLGAPYNEENIPWLIPSVSTTIEAEDYNEGLERMAYYDSTPTNIYGAYRPRESVDINSDWNGNIYITDTGDGEYVNYTLNIEKSGIYDIDFVMGNNIRNSNAEFYLEFNQDAAINPVKYNVPYTGSGEYTTITVEDIELQSGIQILRFLPLNDLIFDKFTIKSQGTGISTVEESSVSVYPNPTDGVFKVTAPQLGSISVSDLTGKLILKENMTNTNHAVDISEQASGIYILSIQLENQVYQQKLIKK